MDQKSSQEVGVPRKPKPLGIDGQGTFVCKSCGSLHTINSLPDESYLELPSGDLSVLKIACPATGKWHNYMNTVENREVYYPKDSAATDALRPKGFQWNAEIICKECKHIHPFGDYGSISDIADQFEFPKMDFSVVKIPCLNQEDKVHEYKSYEIREPRGADESRTKTLENQVNALEVKYQLAASIFAQELTKAEKALKEAVAGLLAEHEKKAEGKQKGTPVS